MATKGGIERAVPEWECMARALRTDMEARSGAKAMEDMPISVRMVEHADTLMTLYKRIRPRGRMAYETRHGQPASKAVCQFSECVHDHPLEDDARHFAKMDARIKDGIFGLVFDWKLTKCRLARRPAWW